MNRRIVAMSLSLVGALIAAGCGGSDDSSRTRNNAIINVNNGDSNFTFVVDCFQDEAGRASSKAAAEESWNSKIKNLEDELTTVNNIAVMPAPSVALPPRDHFSDDASYEAEVARLQAEYESAKALEDVESKSKAERIVGITADLEAAKTQRQAELDRIDNQKVCVGDPGTGGLWVNPELTQPCVTSSPADLSGSGDAKKLTLRVCDEATKLSVQSYDVSYNSLNGSEQPLADGTNRTFTFEVTTDTAGFKTVVCAATGYLNSSVISVQGQNVTTELINESEQAVVTEFCGGTTSTPDVGTGEESGSQDASTGGGTSNTIPRDEFGYIAKTYIDAIAAQCAPPTPISLKENMYPDGVYTAMEPLIATSSLPCNITTDELRSVELHVIATSSDGDIKGFMSSLTDSTPNASMTKSARMVLPQGEWQIVGDFYVTFVVSETEGQSAVVTTEPLNVTVGPEVNDPNRCSLDSFVLQSQVEGLKRLDARCNKVLFDLRAVSAPIPDISSVMAAQKGTLPRMTETIGQLVGAARTAHVVIPEATYRNDQFVLVSCSDSCTPDENPIVKLERQGKLVNLSVNDDCSNLGSAAVRFTEVLSFKELQPDLLGFDHKAENSYFMHAASADGSKSNIGSSFSNSGKWFLVITRCSIDGDENSGFADATYSLVTVPTDASTTSDSDEQSPLDVGETKSAPAAPLSESISNGTFRHQPEVTVMSVTIADLPAIATALDFQAESVKVGFDEGPAILVPLFGRRDLDIPSDAKVLRVTAVNAKGETKVAEFPVQNAEVIATVQSDGTVSVAGESSSDSFPWLWVVIPLVLLAGLAVIVVRRRKLAIDETNSETKA